MTLGGVTEALPQAIGLVGFLFLFLFLFIFLFCSSSSSCRNRCANAEHDALMQEMRYAVGKYCCASLQLYHALMHYRHRLRGKLKKRIKREHNVTQVSRTTVSQHLGHICHWWIHSFLPSHIVNEFWSLNSGCVCDYPSGSGMHSPKWLLVQSHLWVVSVVTLSMICIVLYASEQLLVPVTEQVACPD